MHIRAVLFLSFVSVSFAANPQQSLQTSPQRTQPPAKAQTNAGPITIRGCVNGGRERYTVTQQSTNTTFELQGDTSRFESLRGKAVEVTAREAPPSQRSGLHGIPKLLVKEIRGVAGQCPFTDGGDNSSQTTGTPITVPETKNGPTNNASPTAATPRYEAPGAPNETPSSVGNDPNVQGSNGAPSPGSGNAPTVPPPSPPR